MKELYIVSYLRYVLLGLLIFIALLPSSMCLLVRKLQHWALDTSSRH